MPRASGRVWGGTQTQAGQFPGSSLEDAHRLTRLGRETDCFMAGGLCLETGDG